MGAGEGRALPPRWEFTHSFRVAASELTSSLTCFEQQLMGRFPKDWMPPIDNPSCAIPAGITITLQLVPADYLHRMPQVLKDSVSSKSSFAGLINSLEFIAMTKDTSAAQDRSVKYLLAAGNESPKFGIRFLAASVPQLMAER